MPSEDTYFKPGNKASKNGGRPPTPEDIRKAAKVSKTMFQGVFHKFSLMGFDEFTKYVKKKNITVLEKIVSTIMLQAVGGNTKAAALIWDRMMGRVKEKVEIEMPKPMLIRRKSGEQMLLGHEKQVIDGEIIED